LGALLNAAILVLPALACGQAICLADPPSMAFLFLATLFYAADAIKDLRDVERPATAELAAAARNQDVTKRLALLTGLSLLAVFCCALGARFGDLAPAIVWQQVAGAGLMLLGALLRGLAVHRLGRFFIVETHVAADQSLVRDGVYRVFRHPSETGILAAGIGAAVLLNSWLAAIIWAAAILPLVVVRVRREDAVLELAFGDTWRNYRDRTGSLLPSLAAFGLRVAGRADRKALQ
jgi:protein-S-isoprenylcysteine O-methyltransferase Ste14